MIFSYPNSTIITLLIWFNPSTFADSESNKSTRSHRDQKDEQKSD